MAKTVEKIPAFPVMKEALVRVWEYHRNGRSLDDLVERLGHKSSDTVRKDAAKAARLSASGRCIFCNEKRDKQKMARVDWSQIELCDCLASLRQDVVWHMDVSTPRHLLDVLHNVDAHAANRAAGIGDAVPVVTRSCTANKLKDGRVQPCGERFVYRTGPLAHAIRTVLAKEAADARADRRPVRSAEDVLADFRWPTKCRECRDAARARHENRRGGAKDNAAPPTARALDAVAEALRHSDPDVRNAAELIRRAMGGR